jgi:antitoxin component YwqK of YwqJK toxin-antitoxin module
MTGVYRAYNTTGFIKQIYFVFNENIEGEFRQFYDDGTIWKTSNYVGGKRNGVEYTFSFDDDGNKFVFLTETFCDDKKEGPSIQFYKKKYPQKIENYKDNKLHGSVSEYYQNGNIHKIYTYENGIPKGEYKEYHSNGVLYKSYNCDAHLICDGTYIEYYPNNQQKKIYSIKNGLIVGEYKEFYLDGHEQKNCFYKDNGFPDGEIRTYHDNGQLKSFETYVNDKKHGRCEYFYKSGRSRLISNYNMGKLVGDYKRLRPNGDVIGHFQYLNGKRRRINPE